MTNSKPFEKKYRLLKDLPYAKAGAIYKVDINGDYITMDVVDNPIINHDTLHKQVVENPANSDWFELVEPSPSTNLSDGKREWEIVSLVNRYATKGNDIDTSLDSISRYIREEHATKICFDIHSVKRLSDNVVFTHLERDGDGNLITGFNVVDNKMRVQLDYGSVYKNIVYLTEPTNVKLPTNPIPDTPEEFQKRWNRIQTEIFEEKVAKDTPVKESKEDLIASFIEKYRHDHTMTSHRIAAHITGKFNTVPDISLNEDTVVYNQLGEKVTDYKEEDVDRGMPVTKTMNGVEAYNTGFAQGVNFCEKYGIPKHQIGAGKSTKPPLGLLPKHIWEEQRIWDIAGAVERYQKAGKEIPKEWLAEDKVLRKEKTDTVVQDKPEDTFGVRLTLGDFIVLTQMIKKEKLKQ